MSLNLGRRSFLWGATSFAMLGLDRLTGANAQTAIPTAPPLPSRSDFVIRGAYVLTMDRTLGELPQGDVHVRNGVIAAVGPNIDAPGATVIDGSNASCSQASSTPTGTYGRRCCAVWLARNPISSTSP
jgi:hypothetical protein